MPRNLNTWASAPIVMGAGDSQLVGIDMIGLFPLGLLSGAPTVSVLAAGVNAPFQTYPSGAIVAAGDITLGSPVVSSSTYTSDTGRQVLAGQAVQVQVTGGVDGGNYVLDVKASDGTNSKSLFAQVQIRGIGQPAP